EGPVGGAKVDQHDLAVLDPQLGMMPGNAGVDQAQVAVGAAAKYGQRRSEFVGALAAAVRSLIRSRYQQPRRAGEAAGGMREIAGRLADLAVLDRGAPDDSGPDPERPVVNSGTPSNRIRTGPTKE